MDEQRDATYFPYASRDDAVEEYRALRAEIIESQKQRVALVQFSVLLIGAVAGLLGSQGLTPSSSLVLVALTVPGSMFSYATRLREHRLSSFMAVYMSKLSLWSAASPAARQGRAPLLRPLQRTSTALILAMVLLDVSLVLIGWQNRSGTTHSVIILGGAAALSAINVSLLILTAYLRPFGVEWAKSFANAFGPTQSG